MIDESDMHFVRTAIVEIARCLNHLHSRLIKLLLLRLLLLLLLL